MSYESFEENVIKLSLDPTVREMLLLNPREVIKEKLNVEIPQNIKLNFVENTIDTFNIVLPPITDSVKVNIW
ncbi:MAG: hypothetical protein A2Y34_01165 [Spirochaetes bacterium GWC1_27_15]|nr:MAG: hypothetical protein A2Z98_00965 [Spirochaetes bacterium GWB1_27_13]OHD24060.1 MAG: hypothetical protein A2Y34_01165 [Spirochaetes bacterium GWC1_27_15]